MEHKESLRVLGLTEQSSLQDLSSVFRKMVKKYHPDLNQDREEWSNRQMRYLNEAYHTAYKFLSSPQSEREEATNVERKKEEPVQKTYSTKRSPSFRKSLDGSLQYVYTGMEIYYQYGLEKIPLRREGTRRSRYNSSIRKIKKGFSLLKPLAERPMTPGEEDELEAVVHFIRYVYKSMHISAIRAEDSTAYERKAFRHYLHGSELVDIVIKEVMFKDFVEPFKLGRLTENIKLAEAEFNTVLFDFPEAICQRETEIKRELLYAFLDLTDFQDAERISFY